MSAAKVAIVTGASSGLGQESARLLCESGHDVILACRDEEKAKRVIDKIKQQNANALATYMHLDLADLKSVRKFVEEFQATEKKLSILINNAGVALNFKDTTRQYTEDNFELTIGTNHLGPFLLTNLLLEDLKKAATDGGDARIVVVTSSVHEPKSSKKTKHLQPIDPDNLLLFNDGTYNGLQAYKNSKAANLLFTYELAKKIEGTGVKVNAICPGIVPATDLMRHAGGAQKAFARYVLHGMLRFAKLTKTIQQSAQAIVAIATDEKYKDANGKYFKDGQETKSSEETLNEELQKKIWDLSGRYTSLEGYEPLPVERPAPPPAPEEKAPEDNKEKEEKQEKEEEKKDKEIKENGEPEVIKAESEEKEEKAKEDETKKENKEEEKGGDEKEKNEEETKETEKAAENDSADKAEKIEEAAPPAEPAVVTAE